MTEFRRWFENPTYEPLAERVQWRESRNNPNAVSPVGARGLMQTMPDTERDPGFGVPPLNPELDPTVERRRLGRDYLAAMLDRYQGDQEAALAAYNWGPGRADDWVSSGKPWDALPGETREYIKEILGKGDVGGGMGLPTRNPARAAGEPEVAKTPERAAFDQLTQARAQPVTPPPARSAPGIDLPEMQMPGLPEGFDPAEGIIDEDLAQMMQLAPEMPVPGASPQRQEFDRLTAQAQGVEPFYEPLRLGTEEIQPGRTERPAIADAPALGAEVGGEFPPADTPLEEAYAADDAVPQQEPLQVADAGGFDVGRYKDLLRAKNAKPTRENEGLFRRLQPGIGMIGAHFLAQGTGMPVRGVAEALMAREEARATGATNEAKTREADMIFDIVNQQGIDAGMDPQKAADRAWLIAGGHGDAAEALGWDDQDANEAPEVFADAQTWVDPLGGFYYANRDKNGNMIFINGKNGQPLENIPPDAIPATGKWVDTATGSRFVPDMQASRQLAVERAGISDPLAPAPPQGGGAGTMQGAPGAPGVPGQYGMPGQSGGFIEKDVYGKKFQEERAKADAEKFINSEEDMRKAYQIVTNIDTALNHKGFNTFFGSSPKEWLEQTWASVADSDYRDFKAGAYPPLRGSLFVEGFQSVKGAGQITEYEGKTAAEAITSIEQGQSEEGARKGLNTFKAIQLSRIRRAMARGGASQEQLDMVSQDLEELRQEGVGDVVDNLNRQYVLFAQGKIPKPYSGKVGDARVTNGQMASGNRNLEIIE